MSFFKRLFNLKPTWSNIIFIVEDNQTYAKTVENYIKTNFPEVNEIKIFQVGETCLMELNRKPDIIIMDYFLDSKYEDAGTGLDIVKKIREQMPKVNIILLSAQKNFSVAIDAVKKYNCTYIKKDEQAPTRIKENIKNIYKNN